MAEQSTVVKVGPVVLNYPALFKPRKQLNSDKLKYEVNVLINKKEQKDLYQECMKAVKAAFLAAKQEMFKGKNPDQIRDFYMPLRDGDKERDSDEYKGHWFIVCKSDTAPQVVQKEGSRIVPLIDESEIYSGVIGYVSVNFYAFNKGSNGIAAGLNNVLKLKDGKRLSGRPSAESDFADLDIQTEDDDFNFGGEEEFDFGTNDDIVF